MDTAQMKTTMTAVALVLALGTSAYAQEVKPSITPAAPAATVPMAKPADTATKPVIAPETMQKVGAPVAPVATPAAPSTSTTPVSVPAAIVAPKVEAKPATTPAVSTTGTATPAVAPSVAPKPAAAAPAAPAATKTAAPAVATKLLNVNTVSVSDLEKLPKIGEARAKQIIAGRPYKSVDDLMAKKILPQDAFDAVKGLISIQ